MSFGRYRTSSFKPLFAPGELDTLIRRAAKCGAEDGTVMTITMTSGFEQWNTHETWGQGYIVEGRGQKAANKSLDAAVKEWTAKVEGKL